MEQDAFENPDQYFRDQKCRKIISKEELQHHPQQGLRDEIGSDACDKNGKEWFPAPGAVGEDNHSFDQDRCE